MAGTNYQAVEATVVCRGKAAIEKLRAHGAGERELRYAEFLVKKLEGKVDRFINPQWRKGF